MIKEWKETVDKGEAFGVLITDSSKDFDCCHIHGVLIAQFHC